MTVTLGVILTLIYISLATEGIKWMFIHPTAPLFGEQWEAGVQSMKVHFRRIIAPRYLTCEELSTLLVEIEMDIRVLSPDHSCSVGH